MEDSMRKLVLGLAAAATVLTVAPALAQFDVRAGGDGVSVRVGERDHWRDRDHWRGRHWNNDRVVIRRPGVFASDCRLVTVRRQLPDGSVVVRKSRRCD
jgi:hypothetical protein